MPHRKPAYIKRFFGEEATGPREMVSALDECHVEVVPALCEATLAAGLPLYAGKFFIGKDYDIPGNELDRDQSCCKIMVSAQKIRIIFLI